MSVLVCKVTEGCMVCVHWSDVLVRALRSRCPKGVAVGDTCTMSVECHQLVLFSCSGCRCLLGSLLCRRKSNGHSAQGLLTALHLGIQRMQVCLSVATVWPEHIPLKEDGRGMDSVTLGEAGHTQTHSLHLLFLPVLSQGPGTGLSSLFWATLCLSGHLSPSLGWK